MSYTLVVHNDYGVLYLCFLVVYNDCCVCCICARGGIPAFSVVGAGCLVWCLCVLLVTMAYAWCGIRFYGWCRFPCFG